jgi:hypothetical protein
VLLSQNPKASCFWYNSFSVLFDSFARAHLALRANLRLLYLKGPAFSIVLNSAEFGLKLFESLPIKKIPTYDRLILSNDFSGRRRLP